MNSFSHITSAEIKEIVSAFKNSHQTLFSNYFGLKEDDVCEILKTDDTIMLRKKEHDFYRLFLLSANEASTTRSPSESVRLFAACPPINSPVR